MEVLIWGSPYIERHAVAAYIPDTLYARAEIARRHTVSGNGIRREQVSPSYSHSRNEY